MPRLPSKLLHQARNIDLLLPLLLRACRDLSSARNELRWLREHVHALRGRYPGSKQLPALSRLCRERAIGVPLQYILGSQPFGDLDILCEPGVLIPRPETESYTSHLADLLEQNLPSAVAKLRVLDLCSGTGCISLLLHQRLSSCLPKLDVLGLDVEPQAIELAKKNIAWNTKLGHLQVDSNRTVRFEKADISIDQPSGSNDFQPPWDVLISNPPYISHSDFETKTSKSARNFEPVTALMAELRHTKSFKLSRDDPANGDRFYLPILNWGYRSKSQIVVLEVGGPDQALRVLQQVSATAPAFLRRWTNIEIWCDNLHISSRELDYTLSVELGKREANATLKVFRYGRGSPRALVFSTIKGLSWLRGTH